MKRLFCISFIILLLSSCATRTAEEIANPFIENGTKLSGDEAAEIYIQGLGEITTPSLYYNLAYSYLESGDYEKAIATAEEAIEIYPEYLRFRYLKAFALKSEMKLYAYETALKDILEYDPGNNTIRNMLLEHYMQIGRKQDAADIAADLILSDPSNENAIRALAYFSPFFEAIAPSASTSVTERERLWTEPPSLYMPLGILNGDRLLSGGLNTALDVSAEDIAAEEPATAETSTDANADTSASDTANPDDSTAAAESGTV